MNQDCKTNMMKGDSRMAKSFLLIVLLAIGLSSFSCSFEGAETSQTLDSTSSGAMCRAEVRLEVTHEVDGTRRKTVSTFTEEVDADPVAAARRYQLALDQIEGKILSAKRSQVANCGDSESHSRRFSFRSDDLDMCITADGTPCPKGGFGINPGDGCEKREFDHGVVEYQCDDGSGAIYVPGQNVAYLNPESKRISKHLAKQTQAIGAMLVDAEVATRALQKEIGETYVMGASDYEQIKRSLQEAASTPAAPAAEDLINRLPHRPFQRMN